MDWSETVSISNKLLKTRCFSTAAPHSGTQAAIDVLFCSICALMVEASNGCSKLRNSTFPLSLTGLMSNTTDLNSTIIQQ